MRKLLFLIALGGAITACQNDSDPTLGDSIISYTVDEEQVTLRAVGVLNIVLNPLPDSTALELEDSDLGGKEICITLHQNQADDLVGAYPIGENIGQGIIMYQDTDVGGSLQFLSIDTGIQNLQLEITEQDLENRTVSGTFSGTLTATNGNTVTINNGQFSNVRYIENLIRGAG